MKFIGLMPCLLNFFHCRKGNITKKLSTALIYPQKH